jgi:hypothetical protein
LPGDAAFATVERDEHVGSRALKGISSTLRRESRGERDLIFADAGVAKWQTHRT